jgi:hypothetical protein
MFRAKAAAGALAVVAMLGAGGAAAAEGGVWSLGVSGGTLGISPELGYRFGEHGGLRLNGGFLDYDRSEEIDDIDYDGTLKLSSVGVMADWYPFGGSFRISGGARSSANRIDLLAEPTSPEEIGDQTYTPDEIGQLVGRVDFKNFAPAVTLGWGGSFRSGFTVGFEAGVMMQGSPRLSLTSQGSSLSGPAYDAFLVELEQERLEAEEDAEDFKLWPVLQLHFTYRF